MKELFGVTGFILIAMVLVVGLFALIIYLTSNFEGIASIGILILAIAALWGLGNELVLNKYLILSFVVVIAFLGLIFDRAGNFIYNKPIELLCPADTVLTRDVVIEEDHEGQSVYQQYFSCYSNAQKQVVKELPILQTIGIRFFEYILIGLSLIGIYWVIFRLILSKK